MPNIGELVALLRADISDLDKKLDKAVGKTKESSAEISSALESIPWKALGVAATVATGIAILAMQKLTREAIDLAKEQEAVERRLAAVVKATGGAAGLSAQQMFDMASGLQAVTSVGDETIIAGQAILATFKNIGAEAFERTTVAALDMAEVMQVDLKSAMMQLGKAINDPSTGLSMLTRVGITFNESQKAMIKDLQSQGKLFEAQGVILEELESQFGGAAMAAKDTYGGAIDSLGNTFGDLLEKIGDGIIKNDAFIESIHNLEEVFRGEIVSLTENKEALEEWGKIAADVVTIGTTMASVVSSTFKAISFITGAFVEESIFMDEAVASNEQSFVAYGAELAAAEAALNRISEAQQKVIEDAPATLPGSGDADGSMARQGELAGIQEAEMAAWIEAENEKIVMEQELGARSVMQSKDIAEEKLRIEILRMNMTIGAEQKAEALKNKTRKQAGLQAVTDTKFFLAEMGKSSSTAFEAFKAISIAETVINTIKAAQGAYSAMASIPIVGPALGIAAAAAAVMAGMARVSQIKSMSPGSGSGGGGGGGGGGSYSVGNAALPAANVPAGDLPSVFDSEGEGVDQGPGVQIIFQDLVVDSEERTQEVIDKINDLVENKGVELNASTAIELRG